MNYAEHRATLLPATMWSSRSGPGERAIRFDPGVAPVALRVPAEELLDSRVDLADIWGDRRARSLSAALAASPRPGS